MKSVLLILFAIGSFAAGADAVCGVSQKSTPEIMREKLDEVQQLLRAIVLGEFDGTEEHAKRLDSLAEFQRWFVLPTEEYAQHSREFRKAAEAVAAAGKKEDLGAATDGFISMVRKCVQCHEYMRLAREPGPRR
jgi:hypothetical protein